PLPPPPPLFPYTTLFRSNSYFPPQAYARHGKAIATARAGNVIGGGDWSEDRLVPDLIRSFVAGQPARIRNPAAIRPWQHVLQPRSEEHTSELQSRENLVC